MLSASLEQYQKEVRELFSISFNAGTDRYLSDCLEASNWLKDAKAQKSDFDWLFDQVVDKRLKMDAGITSSISGAEVVRTESRAYLKYLVPYRKE